MDWQRQLFIERLGRWFYWWEVQKEIDAIPDTELTNCLFIH